MGDTEATQDGHLLLRFLLPVIGMSMNIPVIQNGIQSLGQLIQPFEGLSLEGQGAQLFPPWLNQVQPASVLGDELNLDLGPGRQSKSGLTTGMDAQVVYDDQPAIRWELGDDLLQQPDVTGAVAAGAQYDGRLPSSRFECPMDPQLTPPTVVRFEGRPLAPYLPLLPTVGLDGYGTHFVQADHPGS